MCGGVETGWVQGLGWGFGEVWVLGQGGCGCRGWGWVGVRAGSEVE